MESFIPLILIGGLMYLVLILPQQRRTREHKSLLSSLEVGDEVVMNSGIHGYVSEIEADILWLRVAADTDLKISKSAVAGKIHEPDAEGDDAETEDVKDS